MHVTKSGLGEYLAEDDADGIRIAREVMAVLPWNDQLPYQPPRSFAEPLYDPEELAGLVPIDYRKPVDVREVIARIVDGSDYLDFKALYGVHTVCGHAAIEGLSRRLHRQQRADRRRWRDEGRAIHPALLPVEHADHLSAEHDRLHGRAARRSRPASSSMARR